MIYRDIQFYDVLGQALGNNDYQTFVDDLFAQKYNRPQFTDSFNWGSAQIDLTYEQIEATVNVHSMATITNLDSPAPLRATSGATLATGSIPRMKHGFVINEKEIRSQMLIAQRGGKISGRALLDILFNSTDQLIGGNYNRLTEMALKAESTGGYILNAANNPDGIPLQFNFNVPLANKLKAGFLVGGKGTKYAWSNASANPIGDLMDMVTLARTKFISAGVFRMSEVLWNVFINHPNVKTQVLSTLQYSLPESLTSVVIMEDDVLRVLKGLRLPPIQVVDAIVSNEKYNEATGLMEYTQIRPFDDDVVVLRPSGIIGEVKCAEPIVVPDPAARIAMFDGGRTVLTQTFDGRKKIQYIESELTALPVLNRPSQMLLLDTSEATA